MGKFIYIFFISAFVSGYTTTAFALGTRKINLSVPNRTQSLKIDVPPWGKYPVPQEPKQDFAFRNARTNGYNVAFDPTAFEPRKTLASNPLMPARDRGKLIRDQWGHYAKR